ncbi:hypothetical protein BJV82DRAFT_675629 [Fennellomyces sp. T-0311]|nr:hypothetical protein BJV82DRAFT_675629 [Fennellomyces sp. T-0311]
MSNRNGTSVWNSKHAPTGITDTLTRTFSASVPTSPGATTPTSGWNHDHDAYLALSQRLTQLENQQWQQRPTTPLGNISGFSSPSSTDTVRADNTGRGQHIDLTSMEGIEMSSPPSFSTTQTNSTTAQSESNRSNEPLSRLPTSSGVSSRPHRNRRPPRRFSLSDYN